MKSLGIVAEFNPFHEGHKFLIETAKAATGAEVVVAVMSGSFVQRGEIAAFDKWTRAVEAVKNGVSLVVELPAVFACSSAEYFARGGIGVLEGFGCIDYLAFGSESGDLVELRQAAEFLDNHEEELHRQVSVRMKEGMSYPRARQAAAEGIGAGFALSAMAEPNNILAVEYLRHVKTMEPWTVKRQGAGHHSSASAIRAELMASDPEGWQARQQAYWQMAASAVLRAERPELEQILSAGGGLSDKLKNEIRYASSVATLLERLKSKAYTHTRVRRMLAQTLLGIDRNSVEQAQLYIRVLAFDAKGAAFLREVKKRGCAGLPLITNVNRGLAELPEVRKTLEKDILASDLYHLICGMDLYSSSDYVRSPRPLKIPANCF